VACFGPMVVSVWRLVKQHVSLCVLRRCILFGLCMVSL